MNSNQNLSENDLEKIGHFYSLEKSDLKFVTKISNLILYMFKDYKIIRKMMSSSILKQKIIIKNYQKKFQDYS